VLRSTEREDGDVAVIAVVIAAGLAVGAIVTALATRWPSVEAPRVPPATIGEEVRRHPEAAQALEEHAEPTVLTGVALTVAAGVVVLGGLAVGVLLVMVRREVGFARWDLSAASWGAKHATEVSSEFLRNVSMIGGTAGILVIVLVTAVLEYRRIPSRAIIAFLIAVAVGQNLLANGIKVFVDRARPDLSQLTGFSGSSFPSGHSTAAAAVLAGVALVVSRRRSPRVRAVIAGAAAGLAAAVATTRVFLGVHWLTDVMAGLALGWAWFALCSIAFGGRIMRFGAPVIVAESMAPDMAAADVVSEATTSDAKDAERAGQVRHLPRP
jgi:membrane-associated phospholipid phosphatase